MQIETKHLNWNARQTAQLMDKIMSVFMVHGFIRASTLIYFMVSYVLYDALK